MGCKPRMIGCRRDCLHRAMVEDYRRARERDEEQRDAEAIGYAADRELYRGNVVTFRSWLESLSGEYLYSRNPPESLRYSSPHDDE